MGNLGASTEELKEIGDETVADIRHKETYHNRLLQSRDYLLSKLWADAWCAAFVWSKTNKRQKTNEVVYPITEEVFRKIEEDAIAPRIYDEIQHLTEQYQFFHWHLAFPDVFKIPTKGETPDNEQTGWSGGFDVVLGNPPWEYTELKEQEWFATRNPDIASAVGTKRKRKIAALATEDLVLYDAYVDALRKESCWSHFVRNSGRYPLCGRGRINTYAIFAETNRLIVGATGKVGCIVQSGIATDDNTKDFFQDVVKSHNLVSIYDFDNVAGIFPDVDSRYKFCLLTLTGSGRPVIGNPEFVFFAHTTEDIKDEKRRFALSLSDIALLNPNTLTCPIFRSKRDAELTMAVYRRVPVLLQESPIKKDIWGITFDQGRFNMTSDSHLFYSREQLESDGWSLTGNIFHQGDEVYLPLYEGKMIGHFDHRFSDYEVQTQSIDAHHHNPSILSIPRYWIPQSHIKHFLQSKLRGCVSRLSPSQHALEVIF